MPKRLMQVVILALLLSAPLYNAVEIGAYMRGVSIDQRVAATPLAVKLVKDAGFALIFVLALIAGKNRPWRALAFAAPFALAALASILLTLAQPGANPALVLAGLRWLIPFAVAAALVGVPDQDLIPQTAQALAAVFLLSFAMQVFQAFYIIPGWGFNAQGLAFRPPGIFTTANSAAFLAAISMWAAWFYLRGSPLRGPVLLFAPVSVALAASGAGIVAVAAFVFLLMGGRRWLRARLIIGPVLAALILLALPSLTGRRDVLQGSLFGRAGIFEQASRGAGLVSSQFGAGTNSAVLLRSSALTPDAAAAIVDSTYTAALVNTGWGGLAAFGLILIALWVMALRRAMRSGEMQPLTLLGIFTVMGFSTIISEAFPMSLVMAAAIGQYSAPRAQPQPPPPRRLDWALLAAFGAAAILMLAPIAPYAYLVSRAAQSLQAPSAKTDDELNALENDLRSATQLMPMRPTAYAHLAKVAGQFAARNNFARAVDDATIATTGAPNDADTRREAGAVFAQLEPKLASPPFASDMTRAFPSAAQKVKIASAAAWLGRNRAALFWYQQAKADGANSRLFWRNLAAALHATGNTAQGYEAYLRGVAPSTPNDPAIDADVLANPSLKPALDAFESAVCKTDAREDEVAAWLSGDPNWLLKLAGMAADQRRWADALLCYKKDEVSFAGDPKGIVRARPPGPALRRALAAALAQSPDAPAYLAQAAALEPGFSVFAMQNELALDAAALRWLKPQDGAGAGFGGPFAAAAKPGVFGAAGNAGALAQMDRAGQFELSAELGFAPGFTPTSPITLALGFDATPLATFVLQPGQLGWQLAAVQADLPAGYHTLDVWQVAPPQGGAAVNRARLRRVGN